MIKLINLNKIYKSKRRDQHHALKDVTLTLPNTGFIFILGKSGSGKSTLLNLIGGLDSITSGNIIVDGNNLSEVGEPILNNYRNTHIGFIFQDYHLIDELTIYENIVLSLNLKRIEDNGEVLEALEKVGLKGYENRFPSELSGGERQRVAIARAIVKKPRIILADEPTGNLDHKTSTMITEILKELSKECLIITVSHNTKEAYTYADRVIELAQGKVVSDYTRNPLYKEYLTIDENTLYYPTDMVLTREDVEYINRNIRKLKQIVKTEDKFVETNYTRNKLDYKIIKNSKLSSKNVKKLRNRFLKNKISKIVSSSLVISVIIMILSLAQTMINFDSNKIIQKEMNKLNQTSIVLEKKLSDDDQLLVDKKYHVSVENDDIVQIKETGYNGDIYPILSYTVPIASQNNYYGSFSSYFSKGIYINETIGTIVVNTDFLTKKFGEFQFLARAQEESPIGVYITDYVADAIKLFNSQYHGKDYVDLLGYIKYGSYSTKRAYINGVINTGYKERYKELFDKFMTNSAFNLKDLYQDEQFKNFSTELYDKLGFTYSINPNFIEDYKKANYIDRYTTQKLGFTIIDDKQIFYNASSLVFQYKDSKSQLSGNEVIMDINCYNEIFGTSYTAQTMGMFVPHTVKMTQYRSFDINNEKPLFSEDIYIKQLTNYNKSVAIFVSDELLEKFAENDLIEYGLYLDGTTKLSKVLDLGAKLNYEQQIFAIEGIHSMTKAVDVFVPIFELVEILLYVGVIFIIVNFSMKLINEKMHEIGILKALGTKNSSIINIFGSQIFLITLLTCLISTVGYYFFIDIANDVLVSSLKQMAPSKIVLDLDFLIFNWEIAFMDCLIIVFLSIISLVIPMSKIRNIKPVQIIKTKD